MSPWEDISTEQLGEDISIDQQQAAEWTLNTNDEFTTLNSQAPWDRIADLLIELALEYDPHIIERLESSHR